MSDGTIQWAASEADLDAILGIDRVSFPEPWTRAMYEDERRHPDRSFLAVWKQPDDAVAGYISFWVIVDEVHINNVAVRPEARGRGVGRQLVEFAMRHGASRGATRVFLDVRSANQPARRLYERLGFEQVGMRRGYYGHPLDDALILARDLRDLESNPAP
jgi:[ribosomal protein S18]-alanine N-acetyltransferase